MTVPATQNKNQYNGDATTAVYAYTFRVKRASDVRVVITDTTGAVADAVLTLNTDYTLSGVGTTGGNVTLLDTGQLDGSGFLPVGKRITIRRLVALTQNSDIRNQGSYFPEGVEDQFDDDTFKAQQLQENLERGLRVPESDSVSATDLVIPAVALRKNKILSFDDNGKPIAVTTIPASSVSVSAYVLTLLDDATAAAARNTLGFTGGGSTVGQIITDNLSNSIIAQVCDVRLSFDDLSSDQLAKTTGYVIPWKGCRIALYDGVSRWGIYSLDDGGGTASPLPFAPPTNIANKNYDVFIKESFPGGVFSPIVTCVAWTNDTTRASALSTVDGILVKLGDTQNRYLGTFRTTAVAGQMEDSFAKRFLWSYYNRIPRPMRVVEATDSWAYTTATIRQANASTANQLAFVVGYLDGTDFVKATVLASCANTNAAVQAAIGIGFDTTTAFSSQLMSYLQTNVANDRITGTAHYAGYTGIGYHYLAWLEYSAATGTMTWYGDGGVPTLAQSGIMGELLG